MIFAPSQGVKESLADRLHLSLTFIARNWDNCQTSRFVNLYQGIKKKVQCIFRRSRWTHWVPYYGSNTNTSDVCLDGQGKCVLQMKNGWMTVDCLWLKVKAEDWLDAVSASRRSARSCYEVRSRFILAEQAELYVKLSPEWRVLLDFSDWDWLG